MKWRRPQEDDTKGVRRFALLPVWDNEDVYWLEWVNIHMWFDGGKWVIDQIIGDSDQDD